MKSLYSLVVFAILVLAFGLESKAAPFVVQGHYRWRNDNGNEAAATYRQAQDVDDTLATPSNIRLRVELHETNGNGGGGTVSLYYSTDSSSWTEITTDGSVNAWKLSSSTYFNDGDGTTNQLSTSSSNGFESGGVMIQSSTGFSGYVDGNDSREFEICIAPTGNAAPGTNYYFQIRSINGYDRTPRLLYSYNGPFAKTGAATDLQATAATLNGSVNANNASTVVRFLYGTTPGTYADSAVATQSPVTGSALTAVSANLTSLTTDQSYYYAVSASNSNGYMQGRQISFFTPDSIRSFALSFDGVDDFVQIPDNSSLDITATVTLEAWFKTTSTSEEYILDKSEGAFYLGVNVANNGLPSVYLSGINDNSGHGWLYATDAVNDGRWHHIGATYDGSNEQIYVDGKLEGTLAYSGTLSTNGDPLYIGARDAGSVFSGQMDEVRIWNVVRSQSEVQHDMTSSLTGTESGLAAYWRFSEGTGTMTADATVNGNTGTLVYGPAWVGSDAPFPAPYFSVTPSSIAFGGYVGLGSSETDSVTVTNTGALTLNISSVVSSNATDFSVTPPSATVAPSASQMFHITFAPASGGAKHSCIVLTYNGYWSPDTVKVSGLGGTPPHIGVSPDSLYASLNSGDTTTEILTISNTGENDLAFKISVRDTATAGMAMRVTPGNIRSIHILPGKTIGKTTPAKTQAARIGNKGHGSLAYNSGNYTPKSTTGRIARKSSHITTSGLRVAIVKGDFYTSDVFNYLDTILGISVDEITSYDLPTLQNYKVVIHYGNSFVDQGVLNAYVSAGGTLIGTPWMIANMGGADALPAYNASTVSSTPLDVTVTDPADPYLKNVNFVNGNSVGYESGVSLKAGATSPVQWADGSPALSYWKYGSGTGIYLDMHYFTSDCDRAISYDWGKQLLKNAIYYGSLHWVSPNPLSGVVPAGGSAEIAVTFNTAGLTGSDFVANLLVTNNDPTDTAVTVPVHLHVTEIVLPIQLASLSASVVNGNRVTINWMTVSETNNYGFYVERRTPQQKTFMTVSNLIPGAGTSLAQHYYSWTDSTATSGSYIYRLRQVDLTGGVAHSQEITVNGVLGVNDEAAPRIFQLLQNYPNPFNPSTVIKFSVEKQEHATVKIYNILGEEVAQLFNGMAEPGHYYKFNFDGSRIGSGMYYYRIITDSHTAMKKMLMIK